MELHYTWWLPQHATGAAYQYCWTVLIRSLQSRAPPIRLSGRLGDLTWPVVRDLVDGVSARVRVPYTHAHAKHARTCQTHVRCQLQSPMPHTHTRVSNTTPLQVVTVSEEAIVAAMQLIMERMKARPGRVISSLLCYDSLIRVTGFATPRGEESPPPTHGPPRTRVRPCVAYTPRAVLPLFACTAGSGAHARADMHTCWFGASCLPAPP